MAQNWSNYSSIFQGMKIEQVASYASSTMSNIYKLYIYYLSKLDPNISTAISNNGSIFKYVIITAVFALVVGFVIYKIKELAFITKDINETCTKVTNQHSVELQHINENLGLLEEKLKNSISVNRSNVSDFTEFNNLRQITLNIATGSKESFLEMKNTINSIQSRINALNEKLDNTISNINLLTNGDSSTVKPSKAYIYSATKDREVTNAAAQSREALEKATALEKSVSKSDYQLDEKYTSFESSLTEKNVTLEKRLSTLEQHVKNHTKSINEHDKHLDKHDHSKLMQDASTNTEEMTLGVNQVKTDLEKVTICLGKLETSQETTGDYINKRDSELERYANSWPYFLGR